MIHQFFELSTIHIKPETAEWLGGKAGELVSYPKGEYGWFIPLIMHGDRQRVPEDLAAVMWYAHDAGCTMLVLDRDAEENDNLPTYNWD
jgi:hypothetical protein